MGGEPLIPKHGGYRKLKSFQIAQLVYDVTDRFCDRYVSKKSRTHDQMVQAARSGVQNIAEGSQASGTSKKTELKLTNVARASLEELRLDYEDFLRQRGLRMWEWEDPRRKELVALRPKTADDVALWVREKAKSGRYGHDGRYGQGGPDGQDGQDRLKERGMAGGRSGAPEPSGESMPSIASMASMKSSVLLQVIHSEIAANAALVLIGVASSLLDRQLAAQAGQFSNWKAVSRNECTGCESSGGANSLRIPNNRVRCRRRCLGVAGRAGVCSPALAGDRFRRTCRGADRPELPLRVLVKRILRKYGYPPDMQEKATATVLEQAELLCAFETIQ